MSTMVANLWPLMSSSVLVEQLTRSAEEKRLAEAAANAADLLSAEDQEAARKQAKRDKMERQRAAKLAEAARKVKSLPAKGWVGTRVMRWVTLWIGRGQRSGLW